MIEPRGDTARDRSESGVPSKTAKEAVYGLGYRGSLFQSFPLPFHSPAARRPEGTEGGGTTSEGNRGETWRDGTSEAHSRRISFRFPGLRLCEMGE